MLLAIWKRKNDKNTRMKEKFTSRVYTHKKVHLRIETGGVMVVKLSHIYIHKHTKETKKREESQECT